MPKPQHESTTQTWLNSEYITYWGLIWSLISLVLYLTFSVVEDGTNRPDWFIITTTGIEEIGLFVSGCLCWRNWRSRYIPSGRVVWLLLAMAIFAFFVGNLWFFCWEVYWGLDPATSVGNMFFVIFYLMSIAGVGLAILDRDVKLAKIQWSIVLLVAAFGLSVGGWLTTGIAQAELLPPTKISIVSLQPNVVTPAQKIGIQSFSSRQQSPPGWVLEVDRAMQPFATSFNLFYILCDLVLLICATILFLGFWGGYLGLPWRTISQAVICFYIADTWFAYANIRVQGYKSGSIMEVFWIFGIVQFGIAAALEFDNSIRARRLDRRRTAI